MSTFVLKRWFKRLMTWDKQKVDERIVTLEIETAKKLPDEFYAELTKLISKHCQK